MRQFFVMGLLLACTGWLAACGTGTETAGGGDDFPNTLGPVLAQGLADWASGRSLRPDQATADAEVAAVEPSTGTLVKSLALAKSSGYELKGDRMTIYSFDTLALQIVADTVVVAWDTLARDAVADNERVYYFSTHKTRRLTGATSYQSMVPLDTYLRAPDLDTARIRMRVERLNWQTGALEGAGDLREIQEIDLVNFPTDTLRNYPLYFREEQSNATRRLETRLLMENGDTALVAGENMWLRKVLFVNGDSARLQEVGVVPGNQPWHGSARFHAFRAVDYAPSHEWKRTELVLTGTQSYAEGEDIAEGTFRLVVQRQQGTWVWEGVFDAQSFSGTLTGPDGETQEISFTR